MFLKSLRICGDVLINFAVASLGTAILEAELEHVIDRQTLYSLKNYLLITGAVAFGLGCTVYLKWRLRASLWLWLPGLAGLLWQLAHRGKSRFTTSPVGQPGSSFRYDWSPIRLVRCAVRVS